MRVRAADYWATHDSSAYAKDLPSVRLKVFPALGASLLRAPKRPSRSGYPDFWPAPGGDIEIMRYPSWEVKP